MGGLAFANTKTDHGTPPYIPRISPELYQAISADCQSKLETLFHRVVIPRDAPGKVDYGDIDFLVAALKSPSSKSINVWESIKDVLQAHLHLNRGGSHSYAVVHPEVPDAYVQVDVELSLGDDTPDGPELFEWTRFMKGDSDLLQVVGVSHRPLGLTCNDRGLHVRVEEIEPYDKKKALIFLSRDPNQVMAFYGFDNAKYWAGFHDENDLFDWVSNGKFFSQDVFERRSEKSNDRSRQIKRPMYRRFVEEYMPAHTTNKATATPWTRQQVLHEALVYFDKTSEYDAMMDTHRNKEDEEKLWKDIKAILPVDGNSLTRALKGLRRWVVFHNGKPCIASEPCLGEYSPWTKCITADSREEVVAWVVRNWAEVKALEKARANRAKEEARTT